MEIRILLFLMFDYWKINVLGPKMLEIANLPQIGKTLSALPRNNNHVPITTPEHHGRCLLVVAQPENLFSWGN